MRALSLSTSICAVPAPIPLLLGHWQECCGGRSLGLALDQRIPVHLRPALLAELRRRGGRCTELTHPAPAGSPSPLSGDRSERGAARERLIGTIELAHEHGIARVLLLPARLELSLTAAALAHRFALGLDPGLERLTAERAARAREGVDRLCSVLDGALDAADRRAVRLDLLGPAPWPGQLPGPGELLTLLEAFAGAPLGCCWGTDLAHARRVLLAARAAGARPTEDERDPDPGELERGLQPDGARALRLADACGLSLRLPLGAGEIDWEREGKLLDLDLDGVLTLGVDARLEEVERSLRQIERGTRAG